MIISTLFAKNGAFLFISLVFLIIHLNIDPCTSNNLFMKGISREFASDLELLRNQELGLEYVKRLYANFKYTSTVIDANKTVHEMANKLESSIGDIFSALSHAKAAIETMQMLDNTTKIRSSLVPCIEANNSDIGLKISKMCANVGATFQKSSKDQLRVDYVLQKLKSKLWNMRNSIKHQYFISSCDIENYQSPPFLNCGQTDRKLLWKNYISRNQYSRKHVIVLLDHGGSLSKHHIHLVKSVAKEAIAALNYHDNIVLLAISSEWSSPKLGDECLMPSQIPSTIDTDEMPSFLPADSTKKKLLYRFIDGIKKGTGATNHSLGIQKALDIINHNHVQNETVMLLYISRGLLSSLTEAKTVLETILHTSRNIKSPVVINTCAVIDETRPTIYETQFMHDIAAQDYKKYNISNDSAPNFAGTMVTVNSSEAIGFAISHFYRIYNHNLTFDLRRKISLPVWDTESKDFSISFSVGSFINDQFNLLGIAVYFTSWAEDIMYFCSTVKHHYAFLMNIEGQVILHPSFPCLSMVERQLEYVDISKFETLHNFDALRTRLLNEYHGSHVITQFGSSTRYTWRRVSNWYIICIVVRELHRLSARPHNVYWPINTSDTYSIELVYHDLETSSDDSRVCRHLNQVATLDAGSLYLSSSCFKNPTSVADLKDHHQTYMEYLKDNTQEAINPGLRDEIKDEVAALVYVLNFLRKQHLTSFKSKYIVRRYVTSYNGVLQMFPGSILDQGLDPTKRPWFRQAVEHKSKLILVPPYLDVGGAGYIVTLAYATPHIVVSMDLTYGFLYRMLLKRMPSCSSPNITCFIADDRGYLVYHPNLIDPNGSGPIEKQHIVHKESLVASDILSYKLFIRKLLCNSYGGGTVQRYYKLNTSFTDVLENSIHGESCVSYRIVAIPNTNIFVGIVNASCSQVVTFCPCSIVDRLCLNCNRMEQKECECPCECPLKQNTCAESNIRISDNQVCSWFPEHVSSTVRFYEKASGDMESCFPTTCSLEKSYLGCLGVTGCEWCKLDVDGNFLKNPFCASLTTCFNGVLGSPTPYKNSFQETQIPEESLNLPVGFILLFIFGILLVLCMFYVYHRSTTPQSSERLYLSSTQDNHLRMSDLNVSDNFHTSGSHRDRLLREEKPDPVSPYCVSSGYRRIAALQAESDHGYSTMTQHDESEHMSLAPVELESLDDDLPPDNTVPAHTDIDNKQPCLLVGGNTSTDQFTTIPSTRSNNRIVVPVTVHRNLEAT